jgi:hypothetical protein
MAKAALFNFDVQKEARKITVDRSFNAPLHPVWGGLGPKLTSSANGGRRSLTNA